MPKAQTRGLVDGYRRGLKASLHNNAAAYGYSVTVTLSLAVLASEHGGPSVGQAFLFGLGAVVGFVAVEVPATGLFRESIRAEPANVVVLGSALSFASVGIGMGSAALTGAIIGGGAAWPVGAFLATVAYLLIVGVEMALAEAASE